MPVYKGQEFIERIEKGQKEIKRSCKGEDLTYGLYDLNYHDRNQIYIPKSNEIDRYAGGKNRYLPPATGNTDFNDYFDGYKTHWYNGYKDSSYTKECDKWQTNNRPYVKYTDKENFDLYAGGAQKQFTYGGTVTYEEKTGGGGGGIPRNYAPYEGEANYKAISGGGNNAWYQATGGGPMWPGCTMPNCTGGVWGRYLDNGVDLGSSLVNPMAGGDCSPLGNAFPDRQSSTPSDGSIAVGTGHAAIVESIDGNAALLTWSNGQTNPNPSAITANYFKSATPAVDNIRNYGSGTGLGFLIFPGGGGGETGESKSTSISTTECSNQNNPSTPSASEASGIYADDTHRNIQGNPVNETTNKREGDYISSNGGDGTYESSGYNTSG